MNGSQSSQSRRMLSGKTQLPAYGNGRVVTASTNRSLDLLLELICVRIQLTDTQYRDAEQHYRAVSDWLASPGSPVRLLSPTIYAQGSLDLGTTVRPLRQAEFDLDLVCQLGIYVECHPGEVYRLLWDRIAAHDRYKKIMKRLPRCIRLNYAGDFHLDIVPAVPDMDSGKTCILVPDLNAHLAIDAAENDAWKPSNPKGFHAWFDDHCTYALALSEQYVRAHVEPLPDKEEIHEKHALKRTVQLFKRWRDKEFQDRPKLAPPSIILTTLSGHLYQGERWCVDALHSILNRIVAIIDDGEPICLKNPANPKENICEKWQDVPGSFDAFAEAVRRFRNRWVLLLQRRGIDEIGAELADLFEDEPTKPVKAAVEEYARRRVGAPRSENALVMDRLTGALGTVASTGGLVVRPNKFFGDEKSKS